MHRPTAKTAVAHPALSLEWIKPNATVFISSAAIMMIELVAGRIIARHLGASVYTWTSVIGIVLAGIAVGNYVGGIIADKYASHRTLSLMFMCGSIMSGAISILDRFADDLSFLWTLPWPTRVATHVGIVFFIPTAFLGTISPVIAKMALDLGRERGRTIGDIYAWGVVGSLVGTFLAGFFMIAALGSSGVVWLVACILAVMAILYNKTSKAALGWGVAAVVLSVLATSNSDSIRLAGETLMLRPVRSPAVIYSTESNYSYIEVVKLSKETDFRGMHLDTLLHSQIDLDHPGDFRYSYEKIYLAITKRLRPKAAKIDTLTIGGGGYVYPRFMNNRWPAGRTDVVEIDPAVTEAAMAAFGLPRDTTINRFHEDGRVFIDRMLDAKNSGDPYQSYDFIYCDAVNDYSVPYQLTTLEFMKKVHDLIKPDGAYLMNMIDIYDSGLLLGALITTMKDVYSNVNVFIEGYRLSNEDGTPVKVVRASRNTFIIAGTNQPWDTANLGPTYSPECLIYHLSADEVTELQTRASHLVLTDEFAPVENLLARVVRESSIQKAAGEWNTRAKRLIEAGEVQAGVDVARRAIKMFQEPSNNLLLFETLGNAYQKLKEDDKAVSTYQTILDYDRNSDVAHAGLAACYVNLSQPLLAIPHFEFLLEKLPDDINTRYNFALTLIDVGRYDDSINQLKEVIRLKPEFCNAYNNLGVAYAKANNLRSAMAAYRSALKCDPNHPEARKNVDGILGFDSVAIEVQIASMKSQVGENPDDVAMIRQIAEAYAKLRLAPEALEWFDKLLTLTPTDAAAQMVRADCLVELGRYEEAKAGYSQVLDIDPQNVQARQNIERIDAFQESHRSPSTKPS